MPASLRRGIRAKAKSENITVSQLFERAIQTGLDEEWKDLIPDNWEEVASIDFTGLDGYDFEDERIVYKTPGGDLKARHSTGEALIVDDVTRAQVVKWILEATIPEEFQPDFRAAEEVNSGNARRVFDAKTALENAVHTAAALLETLAGAVELSDKSESPRMSEEALEGLQQVAHEKAHELRGAFDTLHDALKGFTMTRVRTAPEFSRGARARSNSSRQ